MHTTRTVTMEKILDALVAIVGVAALCYIASLMAGCGGSNQYSGNDIPHHDPVAWCANVSEYAAAGRCDGVDTSDYVYQKQTPPIQNLWNKAGGGR